VSSLGCGQVCGLPRVLTVPSVAETVAMLSPRSGVVMEGLTSFGFRGPVHCTKSLAEFVKQLAGLLQPLLNRLIRAAVSELVGLSPGSVVLGAIWLVRRGTATT